MFCMKKTETNIEFYEHDKFINLFSSTIGMIFTFSSCIKDKLGTVLIFSFQCKQKKKERRELLSKPKDYMIVFKKKKKIYF